MVRADGGEKRKQYENRKGRYGTLVLLEGTGNYDFTANCKKLYYRSGNSNSIQSKGSCVLSLYSHCKSGGKKQHIKALLMKSYGFRQT